MKWFLNKMLSKIPKDVLEPGAMCISINNDLETYVIKDQNSIIWYH